MIEYQYPIRVVDHHGVVHGALLQDDVPACAKAGNGVSPYGCRMDDPVGRIVYNTDRSASDLGTPCPICYPKEVP